MKTRLLLAVLATAFLAFDGFGAEGKDKKAKSPADQAWDDFTKLVADRTGKLDQPRFKKIITAGVTFLKENPTHAHANDVVKTLADYPVIALRDKALVPQRSVYITTLKYDLLDARLMADTDETKVAFAALDAAAADADMRETGGGSNLDTLREKIDTLTPMPGSDRFLADRERSYYQIVNYAKGPSRGTEFLNSLKNHKDKKVAEMAEQELGLIEVASAPYEMKFTSIDGQEVDFAKLRGKVVAMYFWTSTNSNSTKNWDALRGVHDAYRKRGFEIVTVSFDKDSDRDKVFAYTKSNLRYPVYFDGKGSKSDFATKLAVTGVPRIVIFDQKGIMKSNNLQVAQLESAVKQLLNIK